MFRSLHVAAGALLAIALVGCTTSYKPDVSTETGNPPAIDSTKIALVKTGDEVHVQGESGAVTPPEGEVQVTIVRTEDVTRGPVADDGSFDVEVDATLGDVFEVRAVQDGRRSGAVFVQRDGAQVGEGDGGALSCEQTSGLGFDVMQAAIAEADRACETDDDCMLASPDSACFLGCGFEYVSAEGIASIEAVRESLNDGVCAGFEDSCDELFAPPCIPPEPALCFFGECQSGGGGGQIADGGVPQDLCERDGVEWCTADITWRVTSAGTLPALPSNEVFSLTNCDGLRQTTPEASCGGTAPRCADDARADGSWVAKVYSILRSEAVRTAFMEGGTHGEPAESSGFVYEITVNGDTIIYNSCSPTSDAACAISALEQLTVELRVLVQESPCTVDLDCSSDFEAGECDAAIPVYWHDPKTGLCVPQTYGGCGGNGNRYPSRAACEAACPPPSSDSCPPNRVLTEDVCLECGPVGGCIEEGVGCLLVCSENTDCADEKTPDGTSVACQDGVCWVPLFCI